MAAQGLPTLDAEHGLLSVVVSRCRTQALGHMGFRSCCSWALEHRFRSCDEQAYLPCSMWDLPRPCPLRWQSDS